MMSALGTFGFSAPEIFTKPALGYSSSVDLWSLGVLVHVLLSGMSPFDQGDLSSSEIIRIVCKCKFRHLYTHSAWKKIGTPAKDFVRRLICIDPMKRMNVGQAKRHPWLGQYERELEDLYMRATQGWVKRCYKVEMEEFEEADESSVDSMGLSTALPDHMQEYNRSSYSFVLTSSSMIKQRASSPGVAMSEPSQENWRYSPYRQESLNESLLPGLNIVVDKPSSSKASFYTRVEQDLHDQVVGDGKLRSAGEVLRQVQAKRVALQAISTISSMASGRPWSGDRSTLFSLGEVY